MSAMEAMLAPEVEVARERPRPPWVLGAKRVVQWLFTVAATPRLAVLHVAQHFSSRAFLCASESIARIPGMRGVYSRQAFYRQTLSRCGQDCYFGWMSVFSMTEARIGNRVYIGRFCSIGFADIDDEVMLADHVQVLSGGREHGLAAAGQSMQEQPQTYRCVRIGRGAWIGAGAVVMAEVGAGSIVGAGAVVTRPVPANSVAVGVPARVVKSLPESPAHGESR